MENQIFNLELLGIIFISMLGSLLHFFYNWSGGLKLVGLFSPVNESVWEHMKLILWPTLLFSVFEGSYLNGVPGGFWTAKLIGICVAIIIIIFIFYSYTYFSHHSILFVDISSFFIAVIVSQLISIRIILAQNISKCQDTLSFLCIFLLITVFIIFTFLPPHLPLFKDSRTGKYGLSH